MSLNVKDLDVSQQFYENLGFKVFGGGKDLNYLILRNDQSMIGLFQGMFEGNILTYNPGWDSHANRVEPFDDVRMIQKELIQKGIIPIAQADEASTGPASIVITDPDGNVILIDQHI